MIFIALLLPAILGFLMITLLLRSDENAGLLERACMSFPLGAGIVTLNMFVLGLLRIPLTLAYSSLPLVVEIAILTLILGKRTTLLPKLSFGLFNEVMSHRTGLLKRIILVVLTIWAGGKLTSIFIETGLRPIYAWDSWENWSAGAKIYYYSHNLLLDLPKPDFFGSNVVGRHPMYPLHNALMQVWMALWNGGFDEVFVKFWTPVYLLCMTVYLYLAAAERLGRTAALGFIVIFLSSPLLSYHSVEVYSDLPLATYLVFALGLFLSVLDGRSNRLPLIGLFSVQALLTKDEAIFFVLPLLAFVLISLRNNPASRLAGANWRLSLSLLIPFLLVVPWLGFKSVYGFSLGDRSAELTYHPETVLMALQNFVSLENFNIVIMSFPILFLLTGKPTKNFLYLLFPVLLYAAFFLILYAFTIANYQCFIDGIIFYRNVLTYYPCLCLLTILLMQTLFLSVRSDAEKKVGSVG